MNVSGQLHASVALTPEETGTKYPLWRLNGPQSLFGRCEDDKNTFQGIEPRFIYPYLPVSTLAKVLINYRPEWQKYGNTKDKMERWIQLKAVQARGLNFWNRRKGLVRDKNKH
jgi:hypothetical protein